MLGLDMPSLMLPSFPDLPYCSSGWAGAGEVGVVLEAHLAPTSSWHIPPAQGTEPGVMTSSHPTPRDTESQGASRPAGTSLPAVAGSLCAFSQGKRDSTTLLQQRQLPLPRLEEANSHRSMPSPQDACLFSGALAGMLGAERAMGSLWSSFPAFYPSGIL